MAFTQSIEIEESDGGLQMDNAGSWDFDVIQGNGCGDSDYPIGLYDISKLIKQDEPCLVQAFPDHLYICSADVLADRCHTVLWLGCSQKIWQEANEWYTTMCTNYAFDKQELLHKFQLELLGMLGPDFDPTTGVTDYHNKLLIKTCAIFKVRNPDSPIGALYRERCGPNQLEVIAQAFAPRHCVLCERDFTTDGGNCSLANVTQWKDSGNCACDPFLYCNKCITDYVGEHHVKIGKQCLVKCPGCKKPVICTARVELYEKLVKEVYNKRVDAATTARVHAIAEKVLKEMLEAHPDLPEEELLALVNRNVQAELAAQGLGVGANIRMGKR